VLACLDAMVADNVKARVLSQDGGYKRKRPARGEEPLRAQIHLYREAERELGRVRAVKGVVLEPIEKREA
jgi:polyphosphate kinase